MITARPGVYPYDRDLLCSEKQPAVRRHRHHATYAYLADWVNAVRFLWRIFAVRYRRRADPMDTARTAFRDVTKFGKSCWYLPISMVPYFSS